MLMLLLVLIILILSFIFYGIHLYYKDKEKFNQQKNLIEYLSIFITIIFALVAFYQANESIESSTDDFNNLINRFDSIIGDVNQAKISLNQVDDKLSNLPTRIDSFSNSIKSLNNIISSQKKQLSNTLTDFNKSIVSFTKSVDQMAERFNRKPELKIDYSWDSNDSSIVIDKLAVKNYGSLTAAIFMVRLRLTNKGLLKFELHNSRKTSDYENFTTYQLDYDLPNYVIPDPIKPLLIPCKIIIKPLNNFKCDVFIYYNAAFGNDGVAEGHFSFK